MASTRLQPLTGETILRHHGRGAREMFLFATGWAFSVLAEQPLGDQSRQLAALQAAARTATYAGRRVLQLRSGLHLCERGLSSTSATRSVTRIFLWGQNCRRGNCPFGKDRDPGELPLDAFAAPSSFR